MRSGTQYLSNEPKNDRFLRIIVKSTADEVRVYKLIKISLHPNVHSPTTYV